MNEKRYLLIVDYGRVPRRTLAVTKNRDTAEYFMRYCVSEGKAYGRYTIEEFYVDSMRADVMQNGNDNNMWFYDEHGKLVHVRESKTRGKKETA